MNQDVKKNFQALKKTAEDALAKNHHPEQIVIQIGSATCENASGAHVIFEEFRKHISAAGKNNIELKKVGCTGRCSLEPIVTIFTPSLRYITYRKVDREAVHEIFVHHILEGKVCEKYLLEAELSEEESKEKQKQSLKQKELCEVSIMRKYCEIYGNLPFYSSQTRVALRNCGIIDPENIYEYIEANGFRALALVLEKNDPEWVVNEVLSSKLRGRGGAGFLTGKKWAFARASKETVRYMICNADEGDPGAFMDRSMLESDPFSVIEGMMIAGYTIGAERGFFYIRAEYPMAVERIEKAIDICRKQGLLGKNILGSNFNYDLEVRLGAGAFVCGEETALIHSIEGSRGQPRVRPPFPAQKGLWEKPTIINNVETLANIPVILCMGGKKFADIGTEKSGGTKVFAISGKIKHTGLVEVPMGATLNEIVFDIGGGTFSGKKLKAVQTGGPAGGCIPASLMNTVVDYESLSQVGSIMGSGGLIVLDEDDCMVQVARFFMDFCRDESCGKCTPCREGTVRILEILDRIIAGKGTLFDLEKLERLAQLMRKASLCGLGRGACNPILSTLKYFRQEYEDHVIKKTCAAKKCKALTRYEIDPQKCVGCTMCAKNCPVDCIAGERKKSHVIDQNRCIKCGRCFEACRFDAVKKL
jgi:NADH:ubiquinone oxidoreductase subunit F (NADH-binding)/(2Fe-2S) ferredoxin/NAD-dependent dihydropyrimidine dehydrogenase PreA subunit